MRLVTVTFSAVASLLAAGLQVAAPAAAATTPEVRAVVLTGAEAAAAAGSTTPLTTTSARCRRDARSTTCTREWSASTDAGPVPVQATVMVGRSVAVARGTMSDVLADAPPEVVEASSRRIVAYYSSARHGIEAYGWQRAGRTVVMVGCVGTVPQRDAAVGCVRDLLRAQAAAAQGL